MKSFKLTKEIKNKISYDVLRSVYLNRAMRIDALLTIDLNV